MQVSKSVKHYNQVVKEQQTRWTPSIRYKQGKGKMCN